jgi:hypothetical protein
MSPSFTKTDYTIRSANQTLPLVSMIVEDIVELSREIAETRERLDYLTDGRNVQQSKDDYSKELRSIENSMDQKSQKVQQCMKELDDLNIFSANAINGFVDFPAVRNDQPVFLCWQLGEKEVLHWHFANEDCEDRRPIDLSLIRQSGDSSFPAN